MNKKHFKLSTLAFTVAAILNAPAFAAFTNSADGFTNNGDGTVTDNNTGLVWQTCAVGQTFNASAGTCDGTATKYKYVDAVKLTSDFAGKNDWRLPNIAELNSLVDVKRTSPALNKAIFPTPLAVSFLSSTSVASDMSQVWTVDFTTYGDNKSVSKNDTVTVRLVRGNQNFYFDTLKKVNAFIDNGDGTVTNTKTGLTWQRCAVGQTWNNGTCAGAATVSTQEDAAKITSDLAGKTDWRLPSYRELLTIADYSEYEPATSVAVFPDIPAYYSFWTNTSTADNKYGWAVSFGSQLGKYIRKDNANVTRLVRGTLTYNTEMTNSTAKNVIVTTASAFTSNGDGTVTDNNTGLIWQACAVGQTFNASAGTCEGEAKNYGYGDVMQLTSNFAGKNDWRIPTISELNSIVDITQSKPAINQLFFPNTPLSWFWSSTLGLFGGGGWVVQFDNDGSNSGSEHFSHSVRLVRGKPVIDSFSEKDYLDNKDGTVTNLKTGLTWQRCVVGQRWNSDTCLDQALTYTQIEAVMLTSDFAGKNDWRLPSYKELLTIVDYKTYLPSINTSIFPNAPQNTFWTSTPKAQKLDSSWYVDFSWGATWGTPNNWGGNWGGNSDSFNNSNKYSVRLVRSNLKSEQSSVSSTSDLTSAVSANSNSIGLGKNITYTATVTNNGTGAANNVSLMFMLPPRWTTYANLPADCVANGANVNCLLGSVNAGATASKTITVNFSRRGATSIGALVKTDNDANLSNNMSRVVTTITK